MIELVNCFFVPFISMKLLYKRQNKEMKYTVDTLGNYAIMTIINLISTKVILGALDAVLPTAIDMTMLKYTLVASVVAVIIPIVIEIFRKFVQVELQIERKASGEKQNEK